MDDRRLKKLGYWIASLTIGLLVVVLFLKVNH